MESSKAYSFFHDSVKTWNTNDEGLEQGVFYHSYEGVMFKVSVTQNYESTGVNSCRSLDVKFSEISKLPVDSGLLFFVPKLNHEEQKKVVTSLDLIGNEIGKAVYKDTPIDVQNQSELTVRWSVNNVYLAYLRKSDLRSGKFIESAISDLVKKSGADSIFLIDAAKDKCNDVTIPLSFQLMISEKHLTFYEYLGYTQTNPSYSRQKIIDCIDALAKYSVRDIINSIKECLANIDKYKLSTNDLSPLVIGVYTLEHFIPLHDKDLLTNFNVLISEKKLGENAKCQVLGFLFNKLFRANWYENVDFISTKESREILRPILIYYKIVDLINNNHEFYSKSLN